jgi:hypothetical protein
MSPCSGECSQKYLEQREAGNGKNGKLTGKNQGRENEWQSERATQRLARSLVLVSGYAAFCMRALLGES